jgi:hypothetical protein
MTTDADRLTAIVERAVLLEGADRARFVAEACGDDVELRGVVDEMLADIDRPVIIDRPVGEAAADLLGDNSPGMVGTQIGPYRIESLLGAVCCTSIIEPSSPSASLPGSQGHPSWQQEMSEWP